MIEQLISCAIKIGDEVLTLAPPAKWNDILAANRHKITRQNHRDVIRDGWYLTSHGRFVDSFEARHIAEANGQRIFEHSSDDGIFYPVDIGWGW